MLYVACGRCGNTTPLWCAGGFPPHGPMLALQGPSGALCPYCGPIPPAFTCGNCGLYQMMFFPMLPPIYAPQWMPGTVPSLAPVVQAQPGMSGNQLTNLFSRTVNDFASSFAKEAGADFANALGGMMQGESNTGYYG